MSITELFSGSAPAMDVEGYTVVVVDDGVATAVISLLAQQRIRVRAGQSTT